MRSLFALCCAPFVCSGYSHGRLWRTPPGSSVESRSAGAAAGRSSGTAACEESASAAPVLAVAHGAAEAQLRAKPEADAPVLRAPVGRHIQHINTDVRGGRGLNDRVWMLLWFTELARFNNATMHITGGAMGADRYLGAHSSTVSKSWARYITVNPMCRASTPFNEVEPFEGCRHITDRNHDFSQPLFSGADGCVVVFTRYEYHHQYFPVDPNKRCWFWAPGDLGRAATQALAKAGVPRQFGAVHVRRCDRLKSDSVEKCTAPETVASVIESRKSVNVWLIFYYTEAGYTSKLAQLLQCPSCNRTLIFEDPLELNPYRDGDNFVTFMVAQQIMRRATIFVDTPKCKDGVLTGIVDRSKAPKHTQSQEDDLAIIQSQEDLVDAGSGSEAMGVCPASVSR